MSETADLKPHLSAHLRKVRRGQTLTVLDRETPVARIVPVDAEVPLQVRGAAKMQLDPRPKLLSWCDG